MKDRYHPPYFLEIVFVEKKTGQLYRSMKKFDMVNSKAHVKLAVQRVIKDSHVAWIKVRRACKEKVFFGPAMYVKDLDPQGPILDIGVDI